MRLIKNDDLGDREEESAVTSSPRDDDLDALFSFADDPEFLDACQRGHAELHQLVLDTLAVQGNAVAVVRPSARPVAAAPPPHPADRWRPTRILLGAAAAASVVIAVVLATTAGNGATLVPAAEIAGSASPATPVQAAGVTTGPTTAMMLVGDQVRFAANSTEILASVQEQLRQISASLAAVPGWSTVTVTGYAADSPGSTPSGRQILSLARAQTVADVLVAHGVPGERIVVVAGGVPPHTSAMVNGVFDEEVAAQMRRVEIEIET